MSNEQQLNVDLLEQSFALLAPQADELVQRFYDELFERHPAVVPMFAGTEISKQRSKLVAALSLVVANLRKPDALVPALQQMGERHQGYGAIAEHYQAVATTLLDVMGEMAGSHWTPELHTAWSDALGVIAETMLGAYSNQTEQHLEASNDADNIQAEAV